MGGPVRRLVVAMAAGLVVLALSVGSIALLWYEPVPRRWWSLALLALAACALPAASGLIMGRGLQGFLRDRRRHRVEGV